LKDFTQKDTERGSPLERLYLDEDERLKTHMLVLGSSGEGKSNFLEWLNREDLKKVPPECWAEDERE